MNSAELMPGFGAVVGGGELELEAATFGPSLVHAQQHLGPVLGVGATLARLDRAHGVGVVPFAGEQRAQLELVELCVDGRQCGLGLDDGRLVALFASELPQRLGIVDALGQRVEQVGVLGDLGELAIDGAGPVGIVPEVRLTDHVFEFDATVTDLVDAQVHLGLGEALAGAREQIAQFSHRARPRDRL